MVRNRKHGDINSRPFLPDPPHDPDLIMDTEWCNGDNDDFPWMFISSMVLLIVCAFLFGTVIGKL